MNSSWPLPHMWAPMVSRTTFGARCLAASAVAEASPVRSALRYASTARTRAFIQLAPFGMTMTSFLDARGEAFRGNVLFLRHLADDEVVGAALGGVGQVLHLDLQFAHVV